MSPRTPSTTTADPPTRRDAVRQTAAGRIADQLRTRLLAGDWPVTKPLPTVRALARRENVGHAAVQQAYRQLEAEGLVRARPRIGRFPLPLSPRQRQQKPLTALHEAATEPIRAALSSGLSRTLIRRELLRRVDELHAALCDRK